MTHIPDGTQQTKILKVLEFVRDGSLQLPDEYVRRHPSGNGVSARYFKQVLLISEVNGRISELRAKGHNIETSVERDQWGFSYHRLAPVPTQTMEQWFDALPAKELKV